MRSYLTIGSGLDDTRHIGQGSDFLMFLAVSVHGTHSVLVLPVAAIKETANYYGSIAPIEYAACRNSASVNREYSARYFLAESSNDR